MNKVELNMHGTSVSNFALLFVEVLGVTRQGVGYTKVASSPVGRQYSHDYNTGTITFDPDSSQELVPGPTEPLSGIYEQIHVLYK